MTSAKLWRGQTLRDRSADRRIQLLTVAETLLGSSGSAAVTMRAVCREAQLSPRYFYESFGDREDLLIAVYNRVEERLVSYIFTHVSQGEVTTARDVLASCADFFAEDPRRARILLREPLADDILRNNGAHRTPAFLRTLAPLLGSQMGNLLSPDDHRVALITTAMGGALVALYLDWADGRLNVGRDELVDNAARIVTMLVEHCQTAVEIAG